MHKVIVTYKSKEASVHEALETADLAYIIRSAVTDPDVHSIAIHHPPEEKDEFPDIPLVDTIYLKLDQGTDRLFIERYISDTGYTFTEGDATDG